MACRRLCALPLIAYMPAPKGWSVAVAGGDGDQNPSQQSIVRVARDPGKRDSGTPLPSDLLSAQWRSGHRVPADFGGHLEGIAEPE